MENSIKVGNPCHPLALSLKKWKIRECHRLLLLCHLQLWMAWFFRKWLSMSFIPLPRCRCTSPPNISEYHLSSVAEIKLAWCRLAKIVGLLIIVKQIDCQCTKITKNLDGSWAEWTLVMMSLRKNNSLRSKKVLVACLSWRLHRFWERAACVLSRLNHSDLEIRWEVERDYGLFFSIRIVYNDPIFVSCFSRGMDDSYSTRRCLIVTSTFSFTWFRQTPSQTDPLSPFPNLLSTYNSYSSCISYFVVSPLYVWFPLKSMPCITKSHLCPIYYLSKNNFWMGCLRIQNDVYYIPFPPYVFIFFHFGS